MAYLETTLPKYSKLPSAPTGDPSESTGNAPNDATCSEGNSLRYVARCVPVKNDRADIQLPRFIEIL